MKLLMEGWRSYLLLEGVKDDTAQAEELLTNLSQEKDPTKVKNVQQQIAADPDVRKVMDAIKAFVEEAHADSVEEGIQDAYDQMADTAKTGVVSALTVKDKADAFLTGTPEGQLLTRAGPALIALATAGLAVTLPDVFSDPQFVGAALKAAGTQFNVASLGSWLGELVTTPVLETRNA